MKSKSSYSSARPIGEEEDAFLGFVDYARSVLLSSVNDRSESADHEEHSVGRGGGGGGPPWSWIVSRILKTCSAYSSGVTSAILLSELSQAWDGQNRTGAPKKRPGCLTQLMKKKQKRTKLMNTVTIDSIYEKNFLSANSILEAVVVDVFLLTGTSIYMLSLGDIWSSSTIDLYLHRRYYDLVDLESPENGILKKGREVFLTGCCLRAAVRGSGHLQLLPTEYMVILLDEMLQAVIHQFEACGCSLRPMTWMPLLALTAAAFMVLGWNQDEDAMLLGAQFCSDNFSSISLDAVKDGISFSFYARSVVMVLHHVIFWLNLWWHIEKLVASPGMIESIGLTEVQGQCGNIQRKQITLVDSDGSKLRFLLWGYQVVLANLFSVGSMLAIDRPFIAMASDCNIETCEEFCIEYGSATQLYLVPFIHHKEQVFLASQTWHLGSKSLDGSSQHLIRASQVVLPCDSLGTVDFSNYPFRSFVMDIHDKMTGVSLYGIVTDIYRERSTKETIFILRIEDTTGAVTAKLQFVKSWLEVSWFEQNSGASFVNLSCVPALLNSSCLHKLSFLSDLSILSHLTYTCNVRLDHIEHHHVQRRFLHVSCGHLVNEKSDGLMECSFCQCTSVGEVTRTCHVKTTLADESAKVFAWCTGQTASELLQISAEEFCELPEEEQAMYLYTLENERFTVAIVNSNWKASEDGHSSTPENDTATWEIVRFEWLKFVCGGAKQTAKMAAVGFSDSKISLICHLLPCVVQHPRMKCAAVYGTYSSGSRSKEKVSLVSACASRKISIKGHTSFNSNHDDQPFDETKPDKAVQPAQATSRITNDCVITINEKVDKSPGDPSLKDMERHKWRLLRHVLDRTGLHLEFLLQAMVDLDGVKQERHPQLPMHCVTMLTNAGVKFLRKKSDKFMDIDRTRDVQQLRYSGIIVHVLGSEEEVAALFNKLCREIAFDVNHSYLAGVSADVNNYFHTKWHRTCSGSFNIVEQLTGEERPIKTQSLERESVQSLERSEMEHERRVGVAVDFSPCSHKALKWAVENIVRDGDHLVLVTVRPEGNYEEGEAQLWATTGSPFVPLSEFCDPVVMKKYGVKPNPETLDILTTVARQKEVVVVVKIYWGDPREKICEAIDNIPLSCLVIGSRGLGKLKRALLGSVSAHVVNTASCPVTVVKNTGHEN
ncbi:hypothetical protein Sjap_007278 [Stephania japonica]|uniref:UspA domain-containing protein n=1 Tax=Stephania japonica TaxID=461633 RepID=A0AAP0JMW2_9MAGN